MNFRFTKEVYFSSLKCSWEEQLLRWSLKQNQARKKRAELTHYCSVNYTMDQALKWQKAIQKSWWGSNVLVLLGIATLMEQNKTLNSLIPGNLLLTIYFYVCHSQYFFVYIIGICHLKWGISLWTGLHIQAKTCLWVF